MRNDEFLHVLRRKPPAAFAARLKSRLDLQGTGLGERRLSVVRVLAPLFLVGGAVWAAAWFLSGEAESPWKEMNSLTEASLIAADETSISPQSSTARAPSSIAAAPANFGSGLVESHKVLPNQIEDVAAMPLPPGEARLPLEFPVPGEPEGGVAILARDLDRVGHVALVVSGRSASRPMSLSARHLYLALARNLPDPVNPRHSIPNPHRMWSSIDPALEATPISVKGPAQGSTLFNVFLDLIMEEGCDYWPSIRVLKSRDTIQYRDLCHALREDGVYSPLPAGNLAAVDAVLSNPGAVTILSYPLFAANRAALGPSLLAGASPDPETISSGRYGTSRPVLVYAGTGQTLSDEIGAILIRSRQSPGHLAYGYLVTNSELVEISE